MNIHESEKIAGTLRAMGYVECDDENQADVIVFNTCCIRDNAEKRALGNIGAFKHLKNANPNMILAVVGCMTQQDGAGLNLRQKYPYVDIVLGTNNLAELENAINKLKNTGKKSVLIDQNENPQVLEGEKKYRTSGCNAWLISCMAVIIFALTVLCLTSEDVSAVAKWSTCWTSLGD